jgi:aminopeptidase 2
MQRGIVAGLCVLVVCIAVFFVNQKDPENVKPKRWTFEHLPNSVEPTHYSIQIQPSFEDFTFRGTEVVNINILHDDQTSITLHAHQLKIIEADLEFGSTTIPAIEISYNSTFKQATLHFMQLLPQISAKLKIHFEGSMTNKLAGLYRSEYKNPISQSPSFIISTHMQPNDARQVFPCWDEPAIKSTFSITLLVPSNLTAIANMPIIKTTQISTNLKVKFKYQLKCK